MPSFSSVNWMFDYLHSLSSLFRSLHLFSFLSLWNHILQFLKSSSWMVCWESSDTSFFISCETPVFTFSWSFFFLCSIPSSVLLWISNWLLHYIEFVLFEVVEFTVTFDVWEDNSSPSLSILNSWKPKLADSIRFGVGKVLSLYIGLVFSIN